MPRRSALTALVLFQCTVIAGKSFVVVIENVRFGRETRLIDVLATFGIDSLLTLGAVLLLLASYGLGRLLDGRRAFSGRRGRLIVRTTGFVFNAATTLLIAFSTAFYLMSLYVFWEWGAFLEPHHYIAMEKARVSAGVVFVITRPQALIPIGLFVIAVVAGWLLQFRSRRWSQVVAATVLASATLSVGALIPALSHWEIESSTKSPVVGFFSPRDLLKVEDGLPSSIPRPDLSGYDPTPKRRTPTPDEIALRGAAKDMDVVIVVLESVRANNLKVYGYERETAPTISRMAEEGLVFQDAYVTQPRSSKSILSMTMGVWPDPRSVSKIWSEERFRGKENLVSRLQDSGYQFYFGMSADRRNDHFGGYMRVISGEGVPVVGEQDLPVDAERADLFATDDRVLVRHFLDWAGGREGKIGAMLWFNTAHFPYKALYSRFTPEDTMVDRYDNCIHSSDMALHQLVKGLQAMGREENTLFVVMGDHGEALGEQLDVAHGSFLYEHSVRFPLIMHNPRIWRERTDVRSRLEMKDLPATLFYLLGQPTKLRQSEVVFERTKDDRIYFSNIYQDFKLGLLTEDGLKFVYQPRLDLKWVFDRRVDPGETENQIHRFVSRVPDWENEVVRWYYYQIAYIDREFPDPIN